MSIYDVFSGGSKPFDKAEWAAQKQEQRKEAYELIDSTCTKMMTSGNCFQQYLDVQSRFDRYSVANAILVSAQKPDAVQLKDYSAWKQNRIYVNKDAHKIVILEPGKEYIREDGSKAVGYNAKIVYDISETSAAGKVQAPETKTMRELVSALIDASELRNVWFSYDGKTDVLQGVNLKINDGERMALVGQSGAGKSTVIELISRFYDVQEGEVLIGGKNVKELDYDTILKNVAIVFQKTFLTRDSVLENIRMGSNATLEEVRAAAKEAQIDDFIMSLPDGYDTKVGSFGSRFSGGEKQRIAIARAILKNAPILILDEATSASDPENQMEIDKAIQNLCKGKTVIVVAHRLSALKMCNRVAVVENHTITSVGTHVEVRKNNAYYRKAWEDYETARNITYQLEGGEPHE